MPDSCRITTIEKYGPRILAARENFKKAGVEDRVTLMEGDAGEILKSLKGPYDLIFMDAAKGQYIHWLSDIIRLMAPGAMLFSDNVLQEGTIVQSRYGVERRDRTIHGRMREYLYRLKHMEELETAIVPVGDGVALSVLKEQRKETERNTG
jgi:predicted O-methyltransferase YrrM